MDVQTVKQKIKNIKTAIRVKAAEARGLREEIAVEEVSSRRDARKIRSLEKQLIQLKLEISTNLPEALESAEEELKIAEEAQREAERLLPEQKKMILKIKEASKALLTFLMETEKANQKLLKLNDGFRAMEAKTQSGFDLDGCGGGFMSIKVLIEILERELGGEGRVMSIYPPNFRI